MEEVQGVTWCGVWMCGVRMVNRVSTHVLWDRVALAVKVEDVIIQSRLRCYGQVIRRDINS